MMRRAIIAGIATLALLSGVGQALTPGQRLPILLGRKVYVTPVNKSVPLVTPTSPVVGTLESSTTGSWTGPPTSYTYQWEYFDTSTNISGATLSTYTPVSGDIGHTLAIKVTAINIKGSATAVSAATSAVTAASSCSSSIMSTNCNSFFVTVLQ